LTVFADDPLTFAKDGFNEDEKMFFRIFSPEKQFESPAEFVFDESSGLNSGWFVNEGISIVSGLKTTSTGPSGFVTLLPEIYPNPTSGWVTVSNIQENTNLVLFDVHGQEVYQVKNASNLSKINLEGFPKGVYMLKMINLGGAYSAKIVVK